MPKQGIGLASEYARSANADALTVELPAQRVDDAVGDAGHAEHALAVGAVHFDVVGVGCNGEQCEPRTVRGEAGGSGHHQVRHGWL